MQRKLGNDYYDITKEKRKDQREAQLLCLRIQTELEKSKAITWGWPAIWNRKAQFGVKLRQSIRNL